MKYNFHDELKKVKANPRYELPSDINAPVVKFLEEIGCAPAVRTLMDLQKHVAYSTIDIIDHRVPNAHITIHVDSGMAYLIEKYRTIGDGFWTINVYKTVKNSNLDKSNRKDKSNG